MKKTHFNYKPRITSLFTKVVCIAGGLGILYVAFFTDTWAGIRYGNLADLLMGIKIFAVIWTIGFSYSLIRSIKILSNASSMGIEVDEESLRINRVNILWSDFNSVSLSSINSVDRELTCNYNKKNGSSNHIVIDSNKFDSKADFREFAKLVTIHSGKEIKKQQIF